MGGMPICSLMHLILSSLMLLTHWHLLINPAYPVRACVKKAKRCPKHGDEASHAYTPDGTHAILRVLFSPNYRCSVFRAFRLQDVSAKPISDAQNGRVRPTIVLRERACNDAVSLEILRMQYPRAKSGTQRHRMEAGGRNKHYRKGN